MLQQAQAQPTNASTTKLHGTDWGLVELNGVAIPAGDGKTAHLLLHKKGMLSGFTGCNNVTGSYLAEQGSMQFTPGASTMKMCPAPLMQQEQAFFAVLKATTRYRISGNTLELLNGEQLLAKFQGEAKK